MDRITTELASLKENPADKDRANPEVLESHDRGAAGTYQWEMVFCGHSEHCNRCKRGVKHGPYLYHYFRRGDGRRSSRYIKLEEARIADGSVVVADGDLA